MELIPQEELNSRANFNFAPMIDFLFLMLALFAVLAVSRSALLDTEVNLVQLKSQASQPRSQLQSKMQTIHLSVTSSGAYKWLTEFQDYPMENTIAIQNELSRQYQLGALAQDKAETQVLVHIDKQAHWEAIAKLIFAVRELGFSIRPVYEEVDQ